MINSSTDSSEYQSETPWGRRTGSQEKGFDYGTYHLHEDSILRAEQMRADEHLFAESLGGSDLAQAAARAFSLRSEHIRQRAEIAHTSSEESLVSLKDIARVQRDLYFLQQAAILAMGGRDAQDGIEAADMMLFPTKVVKGRGEAYHFEYECITNTLNYEGDYDTTDEKALKGRENAESAPYSGIFTIDIDPEKRISFSYQPGLYKATSRHVAADVKDTGDKLKLHEYDAINIRLDVDERAPAGIALDVGRSGYESETFLRDSDVLGAVMNQADPENGSHTYDGFTPEMASQLPAVAEALIVKLYLHFKEQVPNNFQEEKALRAKLEEYTAEHPSRLSDEYSAWLRAQIAKAALARERLNQREFLS